MTLTVEAVYENGVLRPLAPLPFPEAQKNHVQIWTEPPLSESDAIVQLLVHAGLVRPRVQYEHIPRNPISTAERRRLAKILGSVPGKQRSEIVIEERNRSLINGGQNPLLFICADDRLNAVAEAEGLQTDHPNHSE